MHHLVPLDHSETAASDKYYPTISRASFLCSAVKCMLTINIEVCEPRLPRQYEAVLVDQAAVLARLDELKVSEPARYEELQSPERRAKLIPAHYLMQYLNDAINWDPEKPRPKVSVRNKFFAVCFWDRFNELFEFLEFQVIGNDDERFMQLPMLDDERPQMPQITPYQSRRAWLEILRTHLFFLLADMPNSLKAPIDVHTQYSTREDLTLLLNAKYAKTSFSNLADYNAGDFQVLGVEKDMHEILLWYAGICQKQTNPSQRQAIFEALSKVSRGREGQSSELRTFLEEEELELVTLASAQEAQPTPLSRAYQSFKLQEDAPDAAVAAAFSDAFSGPQPGDRKAARLSLSIIAKARKSHDLMQSACTFHSVDDAAEFLETSIDEEPANVCIHLVACQNESWFDKILVAAALKELAKIHDMNVALLQFAQQQESESGELWLGGGHSTTPGPELPGRDGVDMSLPVGLQNIRNTCYLNSLLQYFNTVMPVRKVIMNWEEFKLEPTEENIASRRLGGSGSALDEAEAFLASQFVKEMQSLFVELQKSNTKAVRPEQRLALAALKTADQLVKGKSTEQAAPMFGPQPKPNANKDSSAPPALPPRPMAEPPMENQGQTTGPTVTVTPVGDSLDSNNLDTGSNVSSATLVDQKDGDAVPPAIPAKQRSPLDDDDRDRGRSATREGDREEDVDITMGNADEDDGQVIDEDSTTVEEKINKALNDKTVTGTEQQDVEEVMGNILEHLHAAIKPTGTDEDTGKQTDIITETFYWSSIKYIRSVDMKTGKAKGAYRSVNDLSRWMTAFPATQGNIDLYTALDSSFDQEFQEDGNETFTSITKMSPILHVYIQRSQNVNGRLGRNNNIVEIPENLYLDRYMDGASDSDVFKRRQRSWNLKRRLKALDGRSQTPESANTKAKKEDVKEADYEIVSTSVDTYEEALLSVDSTGEGEEEEEYVSILDPEQQKMLAEHGLLPGDQFENSTDVGVNPLSRESLLAELDPEASKRTKAKVAEEKAKAKTELADLFSRMNSVAYRLHAVICHGGGLGGGHYWVWIYDFDKNVWRKYNDERVEVHTDNARVLADLNASGDPYYLAYVRQTDVDTLVAIPERVSLSKSEGDSAIIDSSGNFPSSSGNSPDTPSDKPAYRGRSPGIVNAAHEIIDGIDVDMEDARVMHVEDRND